MTTAAEAPPRAAATARRLRTSDPDFETRFRQFLATSRELAADVDAAVADIIAAVRERGDAALCEFTERFDGFAVRPEQLRLGADEIAAAADACDREVLDALALAAERIRGYHERQRPADDRFTDAAGVEQGHRWTAIEAVGLYVPGGTASYPSSVLMNAVPAKVAGVPRIAMVVPAPNGEINPLVLAAASLAGVDEVYRIGGAQAIAALAYGTGTVRPVAKIVGPGNAYVAAAKRRVFGVVGIDMIAGPSEILIIADGSTPADWVAMDLFSQAEHDELAQAILLCPDADYIEAVQEAIDRLLPTMPRADILRQSLAHRGALIKVSDLAEACDIANQIAPEHLEISTVDPEQWADRIRHAGAIFLGRYTSESLGDCCAGPNHVLPTARTARYSSPLGVYDFQKRSSVIKVSEAGAQTLGHIASVLARGEGLPAHAASAEYRLESVNSKA